MTVPSYTDEEIRAAMAAEDAAAAAFEADNIEKRSGGRKISYDGLALTNDGEPERQGRRPSSATATSAEIQDALDRTAGNIGECLGLTVPEVWNHAYPDISPARDEESVAGWFVEMAGKVAEGGPHKPYGNVTYADAGLQADGKKRYPVDTEAHVRAAWSYINQGKNASAYSSSQLASIKAKIKAATEKFGVSIGGSDSDSDNKVAAAKHARSASAGTLGLTGTLDSRDTLSLADRQREDGNDEAARLVGRHAKKTGLFSDKAKADAKKRRSTRTGRTRSPRPPASTPPMRRTCRSITRRSSMAIWRRRWNARTAPTASGRSGLPGSGGGPRQGHWPADGRRAGEQRRQGRPRPGESKAAAAGGEVRGLRPAGGSGPGADRLRRRIPVLRVHHERRRTPGLGEAVRHLTPGPPRS